MNELVHYVQRLHAWRIPSVAVRREYSLYPLPWQEVSVTTVRILRTVVTGRVSRGITSAASAQGRVSNGNVLKPILSIYGGCAPLSNPRVACLTHLSEDLSEALLKVLELFCGYRLGSHRPRASGCYSISDRPATES